MHTRLSSLKETIQSAVKSKRERAVRYDPAQASALVTGLLFFALLAVAFFTGAATESLKFFHPVSILFTLFWSFVFGALVLILPRRAGRWVFLVLYLALLIYGTAQYIYFKIFNKLFPFTALSNLHEGAGYMGASISYLGPLQAACFLLLLALGIYLFFRIPRIAPLPTGTRIALLPTALAALVLAQILLPRAYGPKTEYAVWNSFEDPRYVYDNYTNPQKCMGLCGYYQFLGVDFYHCFIRPLRTDNTQAQAQLQQFFEDYPSGHTDNDMTGLLKGKNAILIMMESVDYLAVSEQNTPTMWKMMQEGINFTNYYSSIFGDGATFSNEFVLNTGIYSPSNGAASYSFIRNSYSESLPNLFRAAGYSANSFHQNHSWFYNRGLMHKAFGYENYYSFYDWTDDREEVIRDTFLTRTPEVLDLVLSRSDGDDRPFFSFFITYSSHLPYVYDGELEPYAYENYVRPGETLAGREDLDCLMAKTRITDQMLQELLDAVDENTVIICVTDHFAYGLEEQTLLETKGEEWPLRQNTPFFLYCKDPDFTPMQVDKLCSNADFFPTIANLFGLGVPDNLMGHDIFDPTYPGYVIFSCYAWLTDDAYWHDEVYKEFGDPLSEEEIHDMIEYTFRRIECNTYLLESDYYKK